jgi:amino acid transporter
VAVLLLLGTPLLYSLPEALLIGELASMLPVEGGYYQWVKRAFGRFWGFWNGWLSWGYSLMDMAIYPVLLIQYLRFFAPRLTGLGAWLVALALIWGATWLNLCGTRVVGTASRWFAATVLAPFGVLAAVALFRWLTAGRAVPFSLTPFHAAGTSFAGALGIGVSQSIWNYSGWDNASTLGGEIEHATTAYPRALARALPLVTVVYLVSIVPVLALTRWTAWTDGAWPALAVSVAGPWLGPWVAVAGMVSAFALFNALLLAYSRIPLVLAQDGFLPAALARTDARGTPRNAVLVSAVAYSVFALLPFGGLLAGDVLLYTAALALEFAALIELRRAEPGLRGAFRVPAGVPALVALGSLPLLVLVAAVVLEVRSRAIGLPGVLVAGLLAVAGPGAYAGLRARRRV